MRVLLIDDEPMVRKIVRKMLERAGHQAVEAENGRVGIETLKTSRFDLVVTDIIMRRSHRQRRLSRNRRTPRCRSHAAKTVYL